MSKTRWIKWYQVYFILAALYTGYVIISLIPHLKYDLLSLIYIAIPNIMVMLFLYLGIKLKRLIFENPKIIFTVLIINICAMFIIFALGLVYGSGDSSGLGELLIRLLFGIFMNWYFYHDLKKIVEEVRQGNDLTKTC
jgi:hypothetical protein